LYNGRNTVVVVVVVVVVVAALLLLLLLLNVGHSLTKPRDVLHHGKRAANK